MVEGGYSSSVSLVVVVVPEEEEESSWRVVTCEERRVDLMAVSIAPRDIFLLSL